MGVRRGLLAGIPHVIAVAPTIVVLATAGDRLPEPIASHFGLAGTADGFASRFTMLAVAAMLGTGLALMFGLTARQGAPRAAAVSRFDTGRWFIGVSWGTAAFLSVVLYAATAANLDLSDAAATTLPGWTFPLGLLAGVVAGAVGGLVAPRTPPAPADAAPIRPLPLGPTEQVSWSRRISSPWLPLLGGALTAGGLVIGVAAQPGAGIVVGVSGIAVVTLASARVVVDRRGLTVTLGPLGRPRLHVPAEDITAVTVADVTPAQYGGWGYRVIPGGRGVIIRSGPALVVTRRSGKQVTVTVDDAETAAGVLAAVTNMTT
jgi:hypothetical protein